MLTLPPTSLRPGDRACVAISGGADSTALLLMLHAANSLPKNSLGIGISAIHINHSLRAEESDADQAFVADLCFRLEIPLHIEKVDTQAHATAHKETIEEAARNLRYAAFTRLLEQRQATHILTAHTLDDQAETVLMKLLRGAWLEGLSAIAPELALPSGKILRPLLHTRRDDLRAFLTARAQPWREDSSNSDEAFTRNRLRHTLLPALRVENPSIDRTLANLAELAREEEFRWTVELARLLPQLVLPGTPVRGGGRSNSTAPGTQALAIELDRLRAARPRRPPPRRTRCRPPVGRAALVRRDEPHPHARGPRALRPGRPHRSDETERNPAALAEPVRAAHPARTAALRAGTRMIPRR